VLRRAVTNDDVDLATRVATDNIGIPSSRAMRPTVPNQLTERAVRRF
jgi:hypothetical protein